MQKLFGPVCVVFALGLIAASTAVPLSRFTIEQRRQTLPDSTLVTLGNKNVSLGVLRRAHAARESFFNRAGAAGTDIRHTVHVKTPISPKTTYTLSPQLPTPGPSHPPIKSVGGTHPINLTTPTPIAINLHGLGQVLANTVLEPQSQYASAPADMKAFCLNAWAAACLYLPPQQPAIQWVNGQLLAIDTLIDKGQCSSEGGHWATYYGNANACGFLYPSSVMVHFTPASNFKLSSSAQCDSSWWAYTIDAHGAIKVGLTSQAAENLALVGVWGYAGPGTGGSPWCLVYVTKGS
jgi:hypothetical protein